MREVGPKVGVVIAPLRTPLSSSRIGGFPTSGFPRVLQLEFRSSASIRRKEHKGAEPGPLPTAPFSCQKHGSALLAPFRGRLRKSGSTEALSKRFKRVASEWGETKNSFGNSFDCPLSIASSRSFATGSTVRLAPSVTVDITAPDAKSRCQSVECEQGATTRVLSLPRMRGEGASEPAACAPHTSGIRPHSTSTFGRRTAVASRKGGEGSNAEGGVLRHTGGGLRPEGASTIGFL